MTRDDQTVIEVPFGRTSRIPTISTHQELPPIGAMAENADRIGLENQRLINEVREFTDAAWERSSDALVDFGLHPDYHRIWADYTFDLNIRLTGGSADGETQLVPRIEPGRVERDGVFEWANYMVISKENLETRSEILREALKGVRGLEFIADEQDILDRVAGYWLVSAMSMKVLRAVYMHQHKYGAYMRNINVLAKHEGSERKFTGIMDGGAVDNQGINQAERVTASLEAGFGYLMLADILGKIGASLGTLRDFDDCKQVIRNIQDIFGEVFNDESTWQRFTREACINTRGMAKPKKMKEIIEFIEGLTPNDNPLDSRAMFELFSNATYKSELDDPDGCIDWVQPPKISDY